MNKLIVELTTELSIVLLYKAKYFFISTEK